MPWGVDPNEQEVRPDIDQLLATRHGVAVGNGVRSPPSAARKCAVNSESPADAQHAYKMRFKDGAEAMLRRTEFSILKEFKNVPERGCVADQPQHAENLKVPAADASHTAAPHNSDFEFWKPFIIYRCVVGSQAFDKPRFHQPSTCPRPRLPNNL